jgi:hypothetical protein
MPDRTAAGLDAIPASWCCLLGMPMYLWDKEDRGSKQLEIWRYEKLWMLESGSVSQQVGGAWSYDK